MFKKIFYSLVFTGILTSSLAQSNTRSIDLPSENITTLEVSNTWGTIRIVGEAKTSSIAVTSVYENSGKLELKEGNLRLSTRAQGNIAYVEAPNPGNVNFESFNLTITVPQTINVNLKMERGGEIFVDNVKGSIEINNQNGSTSVNNAASWATINNLNGEIILSYSSLENVKAISLITFNGGIQLILPEKPDADVVLRTKQNGYIRSDFKIRSSDGDTFKNMPREYIKAQNAWMGRTGNGGTSIIAITNNGPVELLSN
ncbi:MAG: hypothetical protein AAF502_11215 [Bacteroidota bacterium]